MIELRRGIRIPLRDGVCLSGILYSPSSTRAAGPCLLSLTPYVADTFHERGVYFASRGLPFLIVDARGRGASEGVFRPLIQEARDGYDVVEWLAAQPFCDGKVAMWGGSYGGYAQWAIAKEFPPHLAAIAPVAAARMGVDFPMRNNIFHPYLVQWLAFTEGRALQSNLFADRGHWFEVFSSLHRSNRPYCELDLLAGRAAPAFQEWLEHPEPDDYWAAHNPNAEQCARMRLPVLTITGSYDTNQPGALEHYRQHVRNAPTDAGSHHLVIGPWDHAGTRTPRREFGGLKFGQESLLDVQQLHLEWYRWTLVDGPKPAFLQQPVAYYVMGAERWRYAGSLEGITAAHRSLYLHSAMNPTEIFRAGSLVSAAPAVSRIDSFRYDPTDLDYIDAEGSMDVAAPYLDQTMAHRGGERQLFYLSEPQAEGLEISGFFRLEAWISIDQPDTDFAVAVHEVTADGRCILLSTDSLRARYREGLRTPRLVETQVPLLYVFERFTFVSRRIAAGSRLRLRIGPLDSVYTQKNHSTGGDVSRERAADARPVEVLVRHDGQHASALFVPIGHPASETEAVVPTSSLLPS